MEELRAEDPQYFINCLRIEPVMFDELVQRVGPRKQDTNILAGFEVVCHVDSPSNQTRMFLMLL